MLTGVQDKLRFRTRALYLPQGVVDGEALGEAVRWGSEAREPWLGALHGRCWRRTALGLVEHREVPHGGPPTGEQPPFEV